MTRMMYLMIGSLLIMPLVSLPVTAATTEEKGLAIFIELDNRDTGYSDSISDMEMILTNRHGDESRRYISLRQKEVDGDGDKSLSVFKEPHDVKGTAMLTWTHKVGSDDQWLYLPALKRVKRIASKNKSGSFMGSEFAFEDIGSQEVEKYTYQYLRDEQYNGLDCFVIERKPVDEYSGYTRQVVWIDKEEYRYQKIDFYDRKNVLLKTLTYNKYQQYLGQYWRASDMYMVNHQTGKTTRLLWQNYKFRSGLKDNDFDPSSLKRVR